MAEATFAVRVTNIRYEAVGVVSILLSALDSSSLPAVDPGCHVDVHLPSGMMRSYSLSNGIGDDGDYRITVARDANSGGGSAYLHEDLQVGTVLQISQPRNNFALAGEAPLSIFIAGGIGVTPFIPMVRRLNENGRAWRCHYSVRTRDRAALTGELSKLADAGAGELLMHVDEEAGHMLDIAALLRDLPSEAQVYCCGPAPMLDAYRAAAGAAGLPDERVHFEYFKAEVVLASGGGFIVVCARSAKEVEVAEGQTVLDALAEIGIDVPFSCAEGVCGSCETKVLDGIPDHRDVILSDRQRAENKTMMVCCSGSKTPRLVLDL